MLLLITTPARIERTTLRKTCAPRLIVWTAGFQLESHALPLRHGVGLLVNSGAQRRRAGFGGGGEGGMSSDSGGEDQGWWLKEAWRCAKARAARCSVVWREMWVPPVGGLIVVSRRLQGGLKP